ncbi:MAG: NAD(P)-binding protein, partial [Planctomycetota bacterium]|nr:NAD(P)-binding protein [Planctomycetota bacterium]
MKTTIIGAGATGLSLAFLLSKQGQSIDLYEGSGQPGGLLSTFDVGQGHQLEHFYHHFFTHDAE